MPPRTCQILLASNASCYAKKGFFFLWGNYALEVKDVEPENRRSKQSCSRRNRSEYRWCFGTKDRSMPNTEE